MFGRISDLQSEEPRSSLGGTILFATIVYLEKHDSCKVERKEHSFLVASVIVQLEEYGFRKSETKEHNLLTDFIRILEDFHYST